MRRHELLSALEGKANVKGDVKLLKRIGLAATVPMSVKAALGLLLD